MLHYVIDPTCLEGSWVGCIFNLKQGNLPIFATQVTEKEQQEITLHPQRARVGGLGVLTSKPPAAAYAKDIGKQTMKLARSFAPFKTPYFVSNYPMKSSPV